MSGDDVSLLWLGAALVAGIGIGILVAYWFLPSDSGNRRLVRKNEELEAEQQRYREDVQEHFAKTGELFEDLTKSYRKVYEHLASGAVNLGAGSNEPPKLDLPDGRLLTEAAHGVLNEPGETEEATKEPEAAPGTGSRAETGGSEEGAPVDESAVRGGAADEAPTSSPPEDQAQDTAREPEQSLAEPAEREPRQVSELADLDEPSSATAYQETAIGDIAEVPKAALPAEDEPEERPRALH